MAARFPHRITIFRLAVHLAALAPLVALLWDMWQGNLSVNPIQDITFRTGKAAMVLLTASLAVTPIVIVFGLQRVRKVRRALGLYAFLYAFLHFLTYAWLDYGWDLYLIRLEITEKLYVLVGFAAFLILIPLAITSTKGWQRRLKKRWLQLHKLVYPAGVLVMLHYIWVQKADIRQPLVWTGLLTLLLIVRLPSVRRWFTQRRHRKVAAQRAPHSLSKTKTLI
ncbi:MAG TPA: sulfoxide reductase heme-binding subunit YedZ [Anaerolineae bacterium]|nr:sulfoxide reductase heme-binding subunit YedZ [Anaerolineae bacterium]